MRVFRVVVRLREFRLFPREKQIPRRPGQSFAQRTVLVPAAAASSGDLRAEIPRELPSRGNDDSRQLPHVLRRRPEVDDAGAQEESSVHHGVREKDLPLVLELPEKFLVQMIERFGGVSRTRRNVPECGDAQPARVSLEFRMAADRLVELTREPDVVADELEVPLLADLAERHPNLQRLEPP